MAQSPLMQRFAKWHIWLGWLVGVPILMWMVTGLFMAAKPIEEVRGNHLQKEQPVEPLILPGSALASAEFPIREMRAVMQDGRAIAILTSMDGEVRRVDMATGAALSSLTANDARLLVAAKIEGGDKVRRRLDDADPADIIEMKYKLVTVKVTWEHLGEPKEIELADVITSIK